MNIVIEVLTICAICFLGTEAVTKYQCPKEIDARSHPSYVFGQKCYEFHVEEDGWNDARKECKRNDGDLVMIKTTALFDFFKDVLRNKLSWKKRGTWIGLHDRVSEKAFEWVDGAKFTKSELWMTGEPDGFFGGGSFKDCVVMWREANYKFNDKLCTISYRFICEYDAKPAPTTTTTPKTSTTVSTTHVSSTATTTMHVPETTTPVPTTAAPTTETGSPREANTPEVEITYDDAVAAANQEDEEDHQPGTIVVFIATALLAVVIIVVILTILLARRKKRLASQEQVAFSNDLYVSTNRSNSAGRRPPSKEEVDIAPEAIPPEEPQAWADFSEQQENIYAEVGPIPSQCERSTGENHYHQAGENYYHEIGNLKRASAVGYEVPDDSYTQNKLVEPW